MKKSLLFFFLFLAGISCKKKDPNLNCGCDGPVIEVVTDFQAVHSSGFFIGKRVAWFVNAPCKTDLVTGNVADGDSVIVSGKIHKSCPGFYIEGETFIARPTPLEVTAIRKK